MEEGNSQNAALEIYPEVEIEYGSVLFSDLFTKDIPTEKAIGSDAFSPYIDDYPTVYILYSEHRKKLEAYVGETTHFRMRMKAHIKNKDREELDRMVAIASKAFNQSATYNIESNLISFLLADQRYKLQNKSQTSDSFTIHNYFQKKYYNEQLFNDIWQQLLDINVADHSIDELRNRDVFKLSPYKQLSIDQASLVNEVVEFCEEHIDSTKQAVFVIRGEAGTGKSVVLSCLYKRLVDLAHENSSSLFEMKNYLLVNHAEQLKTYKEIAGSIKGFYKNRFYKPTPFLSDIKKGKVTPDITIVDEAHLLLSHSDAYNNFTEDNHLEEIIKQSKITILVFDDKQVLKLKSYWDEKVLDKILKPYKKRAQCFTLGQQFRMQAAESTINWIDDFVEKKKVETFPKLIDGKDEKGFEFRVFNDAQDMYVEIKEKNEKDKLARMVATFDYEHKKDGGVYYVEEDDFKLPWNKTDSTSTWAERPETIDEVGSIYTVQGFDLNYVGVILGPSVSYDAENECIVVKPELYKDKGAFQGREDIPARKTDLVKKQIILNSINVLMKRGIKGLYIFASDESLRRKLLSFQTEG